MKTHEPITIRTINEALIAASIIFAVAFGIAIYLFIKLIELYYGI